MSDILSTAGLILMALSCAGLVWEQIRCTRKLKEQKELLAACRQQLETLGAQNEEAARQLEGLRQEVWQSANTIHLYAALSQQNIPPTRIQENQQVIQAECERIFAQL